MTNKMLKKLAIASYTKENLDETKVNKITKNLTKLELKTYIKMLKSLEKQKNVYVYLSNDVGKQTENEFKKAFSDKTVHVLKDNSLVAGVRIENNDLVYEQSLKNNLNNIIGFLNQ